MKLLAYENQHPLVVARLRERGFCIESITETTPGAQDAEVLARPDIASLILLTYDSDFGDLIFNQGFPQPAAILYTRMNRLLPDEIADRLAAMLEAGVATGHMTTITKAGARSRPFPLGATNG